MPEKTTGLIVDPYSGDPIAVPVVKLDAEDARLLRKYKKLLLKYGLKETLYCDACWERNLSHGCEAHVTDHEILIRCRCQLRHFVGQTL